MAKNTAAGMSDALMGLLAQADKARGFPQGTMFSVMQQETGGKQQYLQDPSTYHYGLNAEGKRIAGHTGKVSTAFGPFGILESTGRDPGYGVQPLQNKTIEEQVRFAGDYLAARSKQAGGLQAGLAGYGEGGKYGQQVMARLGKQPVPQPQMVPVEAPQNQMAMAEAPVMPAQQAAPVMDVAPQEQMAMATAPMPAPQWGTFQKAMPSRIKPVDVAYTGDTQPRMKNVAIDFNMFKPLMGRA